MNKKTRSNWLVPAGLLLLGSLNVLSGAFQLSSIGQGSAEMTYMHMPLPIVLHIVAGTLLNLLGPLQFAPTILAKRRTWHRWSGRMLVVAGLGVGISGLWMNHFFPQYGGPFKYAGIFVNSTGIIIMLVLAVVTVRQRKFAEHRVWMMRMMAFGLGPGTQRVILIPAFLLLGEIDVNSTMIGVVVWLGFTINLLVVEIALRRGKSGRAVPQFGGA